MEQIVTNPPNDAPKDTGALRVEIEQLRRRNEELERALSQIKQNLAAARGQNQSAERRLAELSL